MYLNKTTPQNNNTAQYFYQYIHLPRTFLTTQWNTTSHEASSQRPQLAGTRRIVENKVCLVGSGPKDQQKDIVALYDIQHVYV